MSEKLEQRISGFLATNAPKRFFQVGAIALALALFFGIKNAHQFHFSYLVVFIFFLTITLGALFFVIIQHLTRAGWSVVVRRIPEVIMQNIGLMAILFVPIIFGMDIIYEHWMNAEHVAHDPLLQIKAPYLNRTFFIIRAIGYFGIWFWISRRFFTKSVQQDTHGNKNATLALQGLSPLSVLLFAITITFASVDWIMSITPHWYSTMIGVYIFAGCMVSSLSVINLIYNYLLSKGYLKEIVTIEHMHDLGKLLFGFIIFWAYISFSQYMLIWYSNIPEETIWYMIHLKGTWRQFGTFIAIGHFALPFLAFMSRHVKRNLKGTALITGWMVIMHFCHIFWIIMPNFHKTFTFGILDLLCLVGVGSLYIGVFLNRLRHVNLVPSKDPRLEESMNFVNV